ncbi:DNA glycosylase [Lipomyces orientalis]|uniref:DNA glycosylase n=1 Tax=Lipomyces orientalis TaxID=1233043 RepID=A0ACC3TTB9_9ASCO
MTQVATDSSHSDVAARPPRPDPAILTYVPPSLEATKKLTDLRERWLKVRRLVTEMRERVPAPVDTMGCHVLPDEVVRTNSIASQNLQILISLLLSSQTKDQHTFAAVQNLRAHCRPHEVSPERILSISDETLDSLIRAVGFHAKKTAYIKKIATMLVSGGELGGRIPTTLDALVKTFPGIGPKMGILYLQNAKPYPHGHGGQPTDTAIKHPYPDLDPNEEFGLAVDTHVLRLSQQFRLVLPPATRGPATVTPEIARAQLQEIVPKEHWKDTNPLLVGFGQTICGARSKMCGECVIAGTGLCKAEIKDKAKSRGKKRNADAVVESETVSTGASVATDDDDAIKDEVGRQESVVDIEDLVGRRRLRPRTKAAR